MHNSNWVQVQDTKQYTKEKERLSSHSYVYMYCIRSLNVFYLCYVLTSILCLMKTEFEDSKTLHSGLYYEKGFYNSRFIME